MDFVAIDVETANADMSSICQIGLVYFRKGELCEEWKSYVDPEDFFDGINISIHGIDESTVQGAPQLPEIADILYRFLDNKITVCHTHFDRVSIRKAFDKYAIRHPENIWLDSARVARRTWKEFAWGGMGFPIFVKNSNTNLSITMRWKMLKPLDILCSLRCSRVA